jgi:anti-sigma regulatory factor (Ser/Thr protein kinase)
MAGVGESSVQISLERDQSAALHGRTAIEGLLRQHVRTAFIRDATLATSELVTNALLHTQGEFGLRAKFDRSRGLLRVEISDSSSELPCPRSVSGPSQVGGLGLRVVATIASEWGTVLNDGGKTVWFELVDTGDEAIR